MAKKPVTIKRITAQEMLDLAITTHTNVPLEQTWAWAEFEETYPGRELVGFFAVYQGDNPVAIFALVRRKYHGFESVAMDRGPVWLVPENEALEHAAIDALAAWIKQRSPRTIFLRAHLRYPRQGDLLVSDAGGAEQTIMMDLAGGKDEILARFSDRGRAGYEEAAGGSYVDIADETPTAIEDFAPYFEIMETGEETEEEEWSLQSCQSVLRTLGPKHCRVYGARIAGELVAWRILSLSGVEAAELCAASNALGVATGSPALILAEAAFDLGEEGFERIDLRGVGDDGETRPEATKEFKRAFAARPTQVAPAYEIPVNRTLFKVATGVRATRKRTRGGEKRKK